MKTKILYCIRHGRSEENETKIFSAGKAPLTEAGMAQAQKVAQKFGNISLDFVHTSPYLRAVQTATEITNKKEMTKPEILDFSYEYAYLSPFQEGISAYSDEYQEIHKQVYGYWQNKNSKLPPHSESFEDFLLRVDRFMTYYEDLEFDTGLFVGHAFFFKLLKARVLLGQNLNSEVAYNIRENTKLTNTGIIIYEISKKGWKLSKWNDDEHLNF